MLRCSKELWCSSRMGAERTYNFKGAYKWQKHYSIGHTLTKVVWVHCDKLTISTGGGVGRRCDYIARERSIVFVVFKKIDLLDGEVGLILRRASYDNRRKVVNQWEVIFLRLGNRHIVSANRAHSLPTVEKVNATMRMTRRKSGSLGDVPPTPTQQQQQQLITRRRRRRSVFEWFRKAKGKLTEPVFVDKVYGCQTQTQRKTVPCRSCLIIVVACYIYSSSNNPTRCNLFGWLTLVEIIGQEESQSKPRKVKNDIFILMI